jgi:hypothetical protein
MEETRVLLRSAAYGQNRSSYTIAEDVLAHHLTFRTDTA